MKRGYLRGIVDFHLGHTLESAQSFRWQPQGDGYVGVVRDQVFYLEQRGEALFWETTMEGDPTTFLRRYLDLDRDLRAIREVVDKDAFIHVALEAFWGMRVLRQDLWECLASFILSSNNHVPRIRGIIERMARRFGFSRPFRGAIYYGFPSVEAIARSREDDLRACGMGYRAPYLLQTARDVVEGRLDLEQVKKASYPDARERLMQCMGVGEKVADCVCLFALGHLEALPVDVWIRRIFETLYLHRRASYRDVQRFARHYFGACVGYAQQYLFHYARTIGYDYERNDGR